MTELPNLPPKEDQVVDKNAEIGVSSAFPKEIGGSKKAEPTRYGDWEINGKCIDF